LSPHPLAATTTATTASRQASLGFAGSMDRTGRFIFIGFIVVLVVAGLVIWVSYSGR
jgi:hypothetical protein